MAFLQLQKDLEKLIGSAKLSDAVQDVDKIIDLLTDAREKVASANNPHTTNLTLAKLQNPIKEQLDGLNSDLRHVYKAQNEFNKALKAAFPKALGSLPTEHDPMQSHSTLINRAIVMHLLREGQFGVASTFINEVQQQSELEPEHRQQPGPAQAQQLESEFESASESQQPSSKPNFHPVMSPEYLPPTDAIITDADIPSDLTAFQSQALQSSFADMYSILSALKAHNLLPAISWARENCVELEARGSNLEFELCKLQFIWLFKGPGINGLPDTPENGVQGALQYARENFGRFQQRHLREIRQLSAAIVYSQNLADSPYSSIFDISAAFDEVSASFTREFCSLLGLSAESPLYVAVTAGALALPWLIKYNTKTKAKGTEWTTANELAFETPLPRSMMYHSIFVCPVSKEQTTESNPPVILPCGHVLAKESLHRLAKGSRYKCPYCPSEGVVKDAKEIIL
ncbi:CTLH/CRA C-terminal to lish motif domain-containing protein [Daldinia caldariorum]|uniref:CTLH/CRA C-terminal to lish motif domain-containing protein n=1 Tax=Daldinia caldariorum TaxID=326644 RepID=UPI0020074907|nr:CTLH/CRA C-terminal to lish motif domain-containing protein [Daldinia caldariorum]KAI1464210.1 CTLH/CRA C-terminal to lish motif domain-containing protein [Daldinia caldariorum]